MWVVGAVGGQVHVQRLSKQRWGSLSLESGGSSADTPWDLLCALTKRQVLSQLALRMCLLVSLPHTPARSVPESSDGGRWAGLWAGRAAHRGGKTQPQALLLGVDGPAGETPASLSKTQLWSTLGVKILVP